MSAVDPLLALCDVTAIRARIEPAVLKEKIQPLLGDPTLREIATLFLTNLGIQNSNRPIKQLELSQQSDEDAKAVRALNNMNILLAEETLKLEQKSQQYKDLHDRLRQSNSLSARRQLLDVLESVLSTMAPTLGPEHTVHGLHSIADEAARNAKEFEKIVRGKHIPKVVGDESSNSRYQGYSKAETLSRYYDMVAQLNADLSKEKEAQQDILQMLETHFPQNDETDTSFMRERIAQRLDCILCRAEVDVLKDKIGEIEPIVSDLKLKLKNSLKDSDEGEAYPSDVAAHRKNIVTIARRNMKLHQKLNEISVKVYGSSSDDEVVCAYDETHAQCTTLRVKLDALVSSWSALHEALVKNNQNSISRNKNNMQIPAVMDNVLNAGGDGNTDSPSSHATPDGAPIAAGMLATEEGKVSVPVIVSEEEEIKLQLIWKIRNHMATQLSK